MQILPVLVSFHSLHWIKVAVRSFTRCFPDERILVVDNNPDRWRRGWSRECETERAWLRDAPNVQLVKNEGAAKTHGAGMDVALAFCRSLGLDAMLHFEPDCLISGKDWYNALVDELQRGAWMVGRERKAYGPIHPTPSVWRADAPWASFDAQPRGDDAQDPAFDRVFDLTALARAVGPSRKRWVWWEAHWDTAQKNWFVAAAEGRAALTRKTTGFHHFWGGSKSRRDYPLVANDPRLVGLC